MACDRMCSQVEKIAVQPDFAKMDIRVTALRVRARVTTMDIRVGTWDCY